jgi:hypothetical protein
MRVFAYEVVCFADMPLLPIQNTATPNPATGIASVNATASAMVTITNASIDGNQISVTLSGGSSTGALSITLNGGSSYTYSYNNGSAVGPGSYTINLPRDSITANTYTSLTATWAVSPTSATGGYSLQSPAQQVYPWIVLGTIRHSQYNTVYESACPANQTTAYIYDSSCNFQTVTLSSKFVSQAELNGTGVSIGYGVLKYDNGSCNGSPNRPTGATSANTLRKVASVTGQCNVALTGGDSVATYPGPNDPGSEFNCSDDVTLVDGGNQSAYHKHVEDRCPLCSDGHIDNYSSVQACSSSAVGDLPGSPYWTVDW